MKPPRLETSKLTRDRLVLVSLKNRLVPTKELMTDISWLNPPKIDSIKDPLFEIASNSIEKLSELSELDKSAIVPELKQFAAMYEVL